MSITNDNASIRDDLFGFGLRLGQLISALNISQNEFARQLGASPAFVSNISRCQKRPGAEFLHRLATTFGVSIDWLLLGKGTMFGQSTINAEEIASIQLRMLLAQIAVIEQNSEAKNIIEELQRNSKIEVVNLSKKLRDLLSAAQQQSSLTAELFNQHIWITDRDERLRQIMMSAVNHYKKQTTDPLLVLLSS